MELMTKDTQTAIEVSDTVFSCDYNESLVHQAVVAYMNKARSGNSAQKTRSEVRGGGAKPWRQKGTGRARAGTIRSPIWRSGGVTFASKKRDYSQKINRKMYQGAMRSIVSELQRKGHLIVLSDFQCSTPKTKDFIAKMNALDIKGALILVKELGEFEYLASRNLAAFDLRDIISIDPVSLLRYENVLITEEALKTLEEQLQ
ncbi:MAG: 50S ribosomal protein L4 [Gammaproteobacteria bacterium]|nr:50S ribosomal protein L4 [Gammaproteobacteria bacterium]